MPKAVPDMKRRTLTMETQRRSLDLPVDAAGHVRRGVALPPTVTRAAGDGGVVGFAGKFIPFGQRQWIGSKRWGFWEVNEAGCITKTVREKRGENNDITFNRDHDNRLLLARTSNGTLRLSEDASYGLADADMGDYSYTRDIEVALERRDLTGMSYAFDMITWEWSIAEDGHDLLTHRELELYDVAVVGMPANIDTDAGLRMDLLSVARAQGFDAASFDALARRLADPDPDLIAALRSLSRDDPTPAPVRSTQGTSEQTVERLGDAPAQTTRTPEQTVDRSDGTPAGTTCTTPHPLSLRTLATRHQMHEGASR